MCYKHVVITRIIKNNPTSLSILACFSGLLLLFRNISEILRVLFQTTAIKQEVIFCLEFVKKQKQKKTPKIRWFPPPDKVGRATGWLNTAQHPAPRAITLRPMRPGTSRCFPFPFSLRTKQEGICISGQQCPFLKYLPNKATARKVSHFSLHEQHRSYLPIPRLSAWRDGITH